MAGNMLGFILLAYMALTLSIVFPDASLGVWLSLVKKFEERKARALVRRQLDNAMKLKKYWVIDMGVLPEKHNRP